MDSNELLKLGEFYKELRIALLQSSLSLQNDTSFFSF